MKKKEEKYEKSLARDDALAVGVVVGGGDATVVVGEESGHPGHYQSHVQIFLDSDLITISDISTWLYIGSAENVFKLFADERKLNDIETTSPPTKVVSIYVFDLGLEYPLSRKYIPTLWEHIGNK